MTKKKCNFIVDESKLTHTATVQFISPDCLIDYGTDRIAFVPSEEIDKCLETGINIPVIIDEHLFTFEDEFKDDNVVGIVEKCYFDDTTKKYVMDLSLTDGGFDQLVSLNGVSIGYVSRNVESIDGEINGGIEYNQIHRDLVLDHLLITNSPRLYSSQVQYINNDTFKNDKKDNKLSCKSNYFMNNLIKQEELNMADKKLKNAEDVPVDNPTPTPSETPAEPVSEPSNQFDLQPLLDVINKLVIQVADLASQVSQLHKEKADLVEEATKKEEDTTPAEDKPTEDVSVEPIEENKLSNSQSKPLTFLERQELDKKLKI